MESEKEVYENEEINIVLRLELRKENRPHPFGKKAKILHSIKL